MGDVGNDIAIYGSRLYAVINCSNKVEVMDAATARRIGQVDIPNCRYIKFHKGYAYVTSYAGPVEINPNYTQKGYVAKVDTTNLQVVATCIVGFQPDDLEIVDGKIYVANSGGYMVPNYENTVSVIDIDSFTEESRITVDINLQLIKADRHGRLWISSRGDYYETPSRLFCYDTRKQRMEQTYDIPVGNMCLQGDSLYIISNAWSYVTMSATATYAIVNTETGQQVSSNFITDGTETNITVPYGIAVNPFNKDIYITDARNYVNPGYLHCYSNDGVKRWSVRTGDIPAHFAFRGETINNE
jgi:DNA-binding beta-propeller fold protein YncE